MTMAKLFKSDGNGGITIPNWALIIGPIILTIIVSTASFVTAQATMKSDIDHNTRIISNNIETLKELNHQMTACDKTVSVIETRLENIEKSLTRIEERMDKDG